MRRISQRSEHILPHLPQTKADEASTASTRSSNISHKSKKLTGLAADEEKHRRITLYKAEYDTSLREIKLRDLQRRDLETRNRIWKEQLETIQARIEAIEDEKKMLMARIERMDEARERYNRENCVTVAAEEDSEVMERWEKFFELEGEEDGGMVDGEVVVGKVYGESGVEMNLKAVGKENLDDEDMGSEAPDPDDPSQLKYCYCHRGEYGEMIACENEQCPTEWFHLDCVGLGETPGNDVKWYCPDCEPRASESGDGEEL